MPKLNRRKFLTTAAAASSAAFLAAAPGESVLNQRRVPVGCIGTGNRGETNCIVMVGQDVKALCDVDDTFMESMQVRYPAAKPFVDWREMLDKVPLEAVVISTPDHQHAPIALAAMKKGLAVYIEKPLAHNIQEVRKIEAMAKEKNIVAWMGNQHHVSAGYRRVMEFLEAGTIGPVKEVHVWTNRPTWAQGIARPTDGSPPPNTLHWDLWLGPAPDRSYHPVYHPNGGWRGWWDFGGGTLPDMGTHLIDPIFHGLQLHAPTTITAQTSGDGSVDVAPSWSRVTFEFPERGTLPALKLTWYDGDQKPSKELLPTVRLGMNGAICVGEVGKMLIPDLGRAPSLYPNVRGEPLPEPEQKITLTRGHQQDWLDAVRAGKPRHDQLSEACRLTELCLAGSIATRLSRAKDTSVTFKWDSAKGEFDKPEANKLLGRTYRKGWELA